LIKVEDLGPSVPLDLALVADQRGENDIPIFQRFVEIIEQRFHIPPAIGV